MVHPRIVVDIVRRMRSFLIELSKQTQSSKGRESKQSKLYGYFTSAEYYREAKEIIETKKKLDEIQKKEEDYHKTLWNKRKEYVEKWFEINKKNESVVSDIAQDDQVQEDGGENPP